MSGYPFWQVTLSGLVVSLPTIVVTVWLSTRSLKRHLDTRTREQTTDFKGITDAQTGVVKADLNAQTSVLMSRRWWQPRRPGA